jgi:tetratricopeptide (TPR) repeat protein/tRNA A-37 threonylcarbamoyl transferase component Bud32
MKCDVSRDQLWAWVHEIEDDEAERARVAAHVASCAACGTSVVEMRGLLGELGRMSDPSVFGLAAEPPLPERIGEYRILRKLGAGGMGVVYEAEQESPDRRVALKVIRAGREVDALSRRMFQRELQSLARLSHAGIAVVYDAGIAGDGQAYYAMELIEGETLSEHLAAEGHEAPDLRSRLRLFSRICDAVQHAHQRGVIHRDLKPSNIMVTRDGGPKVLDFGLARITDQDVQAATMVSDTRRLMGTLQYMSPEQARGEVDAIDVRTDVYALGVVLFEMVTGRLPYDVSAKPLHKALVLICETAPPSPRSIEPAVPADVSTIALRALEKEPGRRYQTVADLAADVGRFLTNRPIEARPASWTYRFGKLVQRHILASALVTAMFVLIVSAAAGLVLQANRIADERDVARREAEKAQAVNRVMREMLSSIDPSQAQGREVTVREVFDLAARTVGDTLADQPEIEAAVRDTIGQVYNSLGAYDEADEQLSIALDMRRERHPGDHADVAETLSHLSETRFEQTDYEDAEAMVREALAMREVLFGETHPAVASSLHDLGAILWRTGDVDQGERLLREALAMRRETLPPDHSDVAATAVTLGWLLQEQQQLDEAEQMLRDALAVHEAKLGREHPLIAATLNNLAMVLRDKNQFDEAEALFDEAIEINLRVHGEPHPVVASNLSNLGQLLLFKGELERAKEILERALAMDRAVFGDSHPNVAISLSNLAVAAYRMSDMAGAERLFAEALAIKRAVYGENHPEVAADLNNLAVVSQRAGELDRARDYLGDALAVNRTLHGRKHPDVATNLNNLGTVHRLRKEFDLAEARQRDALAIRLEVYGEAHLEVAASYENLAMTLLQAGRAAEALTYAEPCYTTRGRLLGTDAWSTAAAGRVLAEVLHALGRDDEAVSLLEKNLPILEQALGAEHDETESARALLQTLRR